MPGIVAPFVIFTALYIFLAFIVFFLLRRQFIETAGVVGNNSIPLENARLPTGLLDDVVHALLADSSTAPGHSHGEIPSKSAPGEFGPASPVAGADAERETTPFEASGSCLLGLALPHLERMAPWASARAARYRHPLASEGLSPLLEVEEPPR
jgi:hypothetical protein